MEIDFLNTLFIVGQISVYYASLECLTLTGLNREIWQRCAILTEALF